MPGMRGGELMKWPEDFVNQIIHGDCLDVMREMPDKSVDFVLTDPPYGLNYKSNYYKYANPHPEIENDNELFINVDECWRVAKVSGSLFIFNSHKKPLVDFRIRNQVVWVKNNWSAGDLTGDFGNQYELIAFLPKPEFSIIGKRLSNVWLCDREPPLLHPTQKPVDLICKIIRCSTNEGDIVLDPFLGSGTTAEACKLTHRRFIGIEINDEYCQIAKSRLAQGVL